MGTVKTPILQLALDLINLPHTLEIAKHAVEGGVDWIEVGTPLIKSEGMGAVRTIKRMFPKMPIVADMKTLDVGGLEVEMAAKAGANIICIMGVSDDSTILESIRAAKKYGAALMVDMLGVQDQVQRAQAVEKMGVDYICIHVGIDAQMEGRTPIDELRKLAQAVNLPIAVAGGLNSETAPKALDAGASIIIVGGAITKAEDVTAATKLIKRAITEGRAIKTELFKKYGWEELYAVFSKVSTPNISDAMHRKGAMRDIYPLSQDAKMVGRAITVKTLDGDWAKPVEAIDIAEEGDVIVIDVNGGPTAIWGELATNSCIQKGIAGVVIDGAVRDVAHIRELNFPVFARHISPNAGEPKGYGEIGIEIQCGGQTVRNRDWIIGDANGVVVVPQERAREIANRAIDVFERENRLRAEIREGSTLSSLQELLKWEKVG
jgi:3-hexulose-6-phosphate synthase/6-phospho-3-hexuloisomerase